VESGALEFEERAVWAKASAEYVFMITTSKSSQ
jgi:hypothetical protein